MSADAFLLYYGIKLPMPREEVESLEEYSHPALLAAEKVGLDTWWSNFGGEGEKYLLFIGSELGIFGWEHKDELSMNDNTLLAMMQNTRTKLKAAGFEPAPAILAQFHPDA